MCRPVLCKKIDECLKHIVSLQCLVLSGLTNIDLIMDEKRRLLHVLKQWEMSLGVTACGVHYSVYEDPLGNYISVVRLQPLFSNAIN